MRTGDLRHRIVIEATETEQSEHGEPVDSWCWYAAGWASRQDLSGRELFAAQQVKAEITTRFVTRYIAGVTSRMRVKCDHVVYSITSAADTDGTQRWLTLMTAREG